MRPIDHRPPEPTVQEVLARLGVADAGRREQSVAVAAAAYDGRLRLSELRVLREASFLPFNADTD